MTLLKIIKLSSKTWKHNSDVDGDFILTKFYAKQEDNEFILVESYGSKRRKYLISEIEVYDIGGSAETFANFDALFLRLEALKYPAFYIDGEFVFNPASYDLSEFGNAGLNPFVRVDEVLSNDISTYAPATTPLAGTEQALVYQDGEWKEVAVSELGGGGGSSLRTAKYEWFNGTNSFASTTNWYGARRNVANQLPLPLWSSVESYYDGTTDHVTNVRMPSYIIDFNQKIERLTFSYESINVGFTFRLIYYELNPSGASNQGVNDHLIYEAVIVANVGGIKKQNIYVPVDFTASLNGYFAVVLLNDSGSTLTAPNWQITANAIEVI